MMINVFFDDFVILPAFWKSFHQRCYQSFKETVGSNNFPDPESLFPIQGSIEDRAYQIEIVVSCQVVVTQTLFSSKETFVSATESAFLKILFCTITRFHSQGTLGLTLLCIHNIHPFLSIFFITNNIIVQFSTFNWILLFDASFSFF